MAKIHFPVTFLKILIDFLLGWKTWIMTMWKKHEMQVSFLKNAKNRDNEIWKKIPLLLENIQ